MAGSRVGMEQEFFVVDLEGHCSNRADELIARCRELAAHTNLDPDHFEGEWVKNILEIKTTPADDLEALSDEYLTILETAAQAAADLDLRLYPLASYPTHFIPGIRDAVNNHVQVRTVGHERFLNAGKCTGVHVHLELPPGTVDPLVGISYAGTGEDREIVRNAYNLGTALDPLLIALGRSCPFYEGASTGLAYHTSRYRGSREFGWEGVYTDLPEVGALRPYADSIEHLVNLQFERHHAWLNAMRAANVDHEQFASPEIGILKSSWNPVRLNAHGTIEHRNLDSNLPTVVLGLTVMLSELHHRVRAEGWTVTPSEDVDTLVPEGDRLLVPSFETLSKELFFLAVTEGVANDRIRKYAQSCRDLVLDGGRQPDWMTKLLPLSGTWQTVEERLLEKYLPAGMNLSREDGLKLVRDACDQFLDELRTLRPTVS